MARGLFDGELRRNKDLYEADMPVQLVDASAVLVEQLPVMTHSVVPLPALRRRPTVQRQSDSADQRGKHS